MNINSFKKRKSSRQKISMVTCYDYNSAKIIAETDIDCVLIGDSVAMVVHGHVNTLSADVDMIATHTQAVARAKLPQWIVADMPFASYRKNQYETVSTAETLMRAGANAVKLEGANGNLEQIRHLVDSGIPVMGHIGLTPQTLYTLGGFKIQGKEEAAASELCAQAQKLQQAGCFALVLECVPAALGKRITEQLDIPTIGIGAGPHTDGQILVWHDLLGLNVHFKAKFLKTYSSGFSSFKEALNHYNKEVKTGDFPDERHSFE